MSEHQSPRLRTVDKVKPPFKLNDFPAQFSERLSKAIVYLMATREHPELEGKDWEVIFANAIGAEWKPSNVGLDDVVLDQCAWGAKTIKHASPSAAQRVRLIAGRNSPVYSFGEEKVAGNDPNRLGSQVLDIWNERVSAIRRLHKHVRTVVLIKSHDLRELVVFEFDTVRYDPEQYEWTWNKRGNLEGYLRATGEHCFTWQPHGSQFTIIEPVPPERLAIKLKQVPRKLTQDDVLRAIGYEQDAWVEIVRGSNI